MPAIRSTLPILGLFLLLSSCSWSSLNPWAEEQKAEPAAVVRAEQPPALPAPARTPGTVEIVWLVPGEAVERYHIRWGTSPNILDSSTVVAVEDLRKIEDPVFGPIYRYKVGPVDDHLPLFLSIQAENRWGLSSASEPILVPAVRSR